ncbi:radical SAM family heme chaperone HemW, partial [bacterium]|nr:radical SAM family heme chaperone HemW [bacterium]
YCAFATWDNKGDLRDAYMQALLREVEEACANGLPLLDTVFVGGGTPSLVPPESLAKVIQTLRVSSAAEITVECNPDNVTQQLLTVYKEAGVNRISLGVQSMVPHVLQSLGREHNPENVVRAVEAIRTVGFTSFNMDLIYGAHGESVDDWVHTVESALALQPPHISAYGLTVEPGTPLAQDASRHPDDDDQADKYPIVDDMLEHAGLHNYEISNWAQLGHESAHNRLYWSQSNYRGFGCAAHSHENGRRWWNVRTPERYIELVSGGESVENASETLSEVQVKEERVQLAIRRREGVPLSELPHEIPYELLGLVNVVGKNLILTREGRLLANEVTIRLL